MSNKRALNQRRRASTPKKILASLRSPAAKIIFQTIMERNRYLFLQSLEQRYPLKKVKASLWRGTALHLLELSDKISPGMHQAATHYLEISHQILREGPQQPCSKFEGSLSHRAIPSYDQKQDPCQELALEQHWKKISLILQEARIKKVVDALGDIHDLSVLDHVLRTRETLVQLQKGLGRLKAYLAEERI